VVLKNFAETEANGVVIIDQEDLAGALGLLVDGCCVSSCAIDRSDLRFGLVVIAYSSLERLAARAGVGAGSSIFGLEAFCSGNWSCSTTLRRDL
jgi:hypothetical protein